MSAVRSHTVIEVWGEVFVFVFFGLVATVGSRYVHDSTAPVDAWIAAIPMGMLAAAILVANNRRDIDTDAAVGKRTLAVVLGRHRTVTLYAFLTYGAFAVIAVAASTGLLPRPTLVSVLLSPLALGPNRLLASGVEGPALIPALGATARLELLTGLALFIGTAIA